MEDNLDHAVSKLLRAMQNAMDWQVEEHGEDWSDDDDLWAIFFDDLSESVACGYTGNVGSENIDEIVKVALKELESREDWRSGVLVEAKEYQRRWEEEDAKSQSQ